MKKTKKTLNLIALIGFLVSNFLTPLSYAVDNLEQISTTSSQNDETVISNDSEKSTEQEDSEIPMDSSASASEGQALSEVDSQLDAQNDENGQEGEDNDVLLGGKEVAEDENPQTKDFYTEDDKNLQSSTSLNPASLDKEAQDASLTKKGNLDEIEAEDLPELTPLEKGPMLMSAGNTQLNWTEGVDFHTISIAKPAGVTDEGPAGFTIMDRNLGATGNEVDTTHGSYTNGTGSYGYHYQWGNNYGFSQGCTITSQYGSCSDEIVPDTNGLSWDSGYNNSGYYSTAFINGNNFDYDVRDDSSHHDGLRGGAADSSDNNRGANETNPEDRQGPCPDGYHVPSAGEWGLLIKYWAYASGYNSLVNGSEGLYYIDDTTARTNFMEYFKLPFAGFRGYFNAFLNGQGSDGIYWSSSPYGSDDPNRRARRLYLGSSLVRADDYEYRAHGYSVRCFKDTYEVPSTYIVRFLDDGIEIDSGAVTQGGLRSEEVPTPEQREGYDFDYRYADGENSEFDFTAPITENTTLHAKWTFTAIIPNGIYTGLNGGDITVVWSDDMRGDINLTLAGDNLEGYYYRGWNEMADNNWSMNPTNGENYNNNRGGGGDTYDNGFDDGNERYKRQGPCPEGYHIPSRGEWNTLAIAWCNIDTGCNARYSDVQIGGVSGHLIKVTGNNAWTESNKLIFVSNLGWGTKFKTAFNMLSSDEDFWSSSPDLDDNDRAWELYVLGHYISPDSTYGRNNDIRVRCFKNYMTIPAISYTIELDANGGEVVETTLETDSEGKVTLPNATRVADENGEWIFEGWFASTGESEKIGNSGAVITLTEDMEVYAHWAQTITIRDPENPLSGFTIMDRNLGAITNDISSGASYGFHYQWGNNYGFLQSLNKDDNPEYFSGISATYEDYGPSKPYNNPIFRYGNTDYWDTSNDHYDNLWGGENDAQANNWGANEINPKDRQGPCPEGYHVPSAGEWGLIIKYYRDTYATAVTLYGTNGLYYFNNADACSGFIAYFHIPFAGLRRYNDTFINHQASYGYYWSSSPHGEGYITGEARNFIFYPSYVGAGDYEGKRGYGNSVRCFKNTYETPTSTYILTFDSQSGSEVVPRYTIPEQPWSRPENPTRDDYTFLDWYTSTGYETVFDFSTPATGNLTVYAKWQKSCTSGTTYYDELGACATRDTDDIVYYWTGSDGKGLISIISGDIILTMLDKNEGASVAGTGEDSYGELYQRGNNAPVKEAPTSTGTVEYANYRPGHSFYDENFRYGSSMYDYWQDDIHYNNLWGGSGDDTAGDWGGINNGDTRQGPCDTGYHVPSIMEWDTVLQMFASSVGQNLNGSTLHYFTNSINAGKFRNAFLLPFAGYRNYTNTSINNQENGIYWSSSPSGGNDFEYAHTLGLYSYSVYTDSDSIRAYGLSVRCFKDSPDASQTLILTFDINGGELSGADSEGKLIQKVESGKLAQEPVKYARDGYTFVNWYTSTGYETEFDFSTPLAEDMTVYAKWKNEKDIVLEATATEAEDTLTINKYFANAYTVDRGDGTTGNLTADTTHTYATAGTYTIILSLSGADRWTFQNAQKPLVPRNGTSMTGVKITYMPSLADGFGSNSTVPGNNFFYSFNREGKLVGLPEGSFDTINITAVGNYFFSSFNQNGQLTSLPTGSFNISNISGTVGNYFFSSFNQNGKLISLPADSFDTSNITSVGDYFFAQFNNCNCSQLMASLFNDCSQLTSLPTGSFNISNIRTVGNSFFHGFNYNGAITSLPEGSFDASNIISVGVLDFFAYFNYYGKLTDLPDSFKLSSTGASRNYSYSYAFNSPGYTLNKKVSDLVSGVTVPSSDRNTFSDNQPGRCGVHANWLVTTADACSISYDDGLGGTGEFKYTANTTGVVVGSGMTEPTRSGYTFKGWYDASGNKIDEVIFPDMDGETLYAQWNATLYEITYHLDGGTQVSPKTGYTVEDDTFTLVNPTRTNYLFAGWTGSNGDDPETTVTITQGSKYEDLEYYANWYEDFNDDGINDEEEDHFTLEFTGGENGTLSGQTIWPEILTGLTIDEAGITIPEVIPNSGYMFSGWSPEITGGTVITSGLTLTPIYGEDKNGNGINDEEEDHFTLEFTGGENGTLSGQTIWPEILTGLTIDEAGITIPEVIPNSGYMFSGWSPEITGGTVITSGLTLTPIYGEDTNENGINDEEETKYKLTVNYVYSRGGEASPSVSGMYLSGIAFNYVSPNVQYYTANSGTVSGTGIEQDQTFTVVYKPNNDKNQNGIADEEETPSGGGSSGGGGGGGGGGGSSGGKTETGSNAGGQTGNNAGGQTGNQINSNTGDTVTGTNTQEPKNTTGNNIQTGNQVPQNNVSSGTNVKDLTGETENSSANASEGQAYTQEFQQAYQFAHENGITTMPTIQKAEMNSSLTRIAMAKMLSQYAINILGKKPKTRVIPKFNDVTEKMDSDYDNGVTLAYQLGIMGQNMPGNKFRPDDEVTRAEFVTALSRLLYNTSDGKYKSTAEYYVNHMKKLKQEGIITKDDPSMKELRGYVMIMLMRSAK